MADTPTTILIAAAAALAGNVVTSLLGARIKRKETDAAAAERQRIELATAKAKANEAETTGRFAVAQAEVGAVPALLARIRELEAEAKERARELAELQEATADAIARASAAEAARAACEQRCGALAHELEETLRSIGR
jgi:hypothetical protein